jgi:hypothetical protein
VKLAALLVGFLLVANALAQQPDRSAPAGVIYGIVSDQNGHPSAGIGLTAFPLGVPVGGILPTTKTDQNGKYTFRQLPWWGRYTVYPEDELAGYSSLITGQANPGHPGVVTLSPQHPEEELDFRLPPRAGFLHIRLTNRRNGDVIPSVRVSVASPQDHGRLLFSRSCSSDRVILLPPDEDLLVHIMSPGFSEWDGSAGT